MIDIVVGIAAVLVLWILYLLLCSLRIGAADRRLQRQRAQ